MQGKRVAQEKKTDTKTDLYMLLHDFIWILAGVTVTFVFLIRLVGVSGPSMTPTLLDGEYVLLLSNFVSRDYDPGDIVVATVPTYDDSKPLVKRVIATGGQTVDIDFTKGEVRVDGILLDEPYIKEPTYLNYSNGFTYPVTVPEGCVFLMGDNRNDSGDSRYAPIGFVSEEDILGRVILRILPLNRIGVVR